MLIRSSCEQQRLFRNRMGEQSFSSNPRSWFKVLKRRIVLKPISAWLLMRRRRWIDHSGVIKLSLLYCWVKIQSALYHFNNPSNSAEHNKNTFFQEPSSFIPLLSVKHIPSRHFIHTIIHYLNHWFSFQAPFFIYADGYCFIYKSVKCSRIL